MKYCKLRIACSAFWGVVAVLLIVLWVRSYSIVETLHLPVTSKSSLGLASEPGLIAIVFCPRQTSGYDQRPVEFWRTNGLKPSSTVWGGYQNIANAVRILWMPSWLLLLAATGCAIAPWRRELRWRFSLRTLLFVTTLVAVVLGLIVWLQ
jgi:hypothetical protein